MYIFLYTHKNLHLYMGVHEMSYYNIYLYTIYICTVGRSACYGKHETRSHALAPLFDYVWRVHFSKSFRWDDSISTVHKKIERIHWNQNILSVCSRCRQFKFYNEVARFVLSEKIVRPALFTGYDDVLM